MTNSTETPRDRAIKYYNEWKDWREQLRPYWTQIDKNQEMYEFYKREDSETSSDVSLNTPFTVVESLVAKSNETNLVVNVMAKGKNDMQDFEEWISAILKDAIENPDVEAVVGAFRKIKEQYEREFYVKGNAFAEIQWLRKTALVNGEKEKIADGPYCRVLPYKSVIFNPTKTAADSDVYYVEKYVSWKELKEREYNEKENKTGIYRNLYSLKRKFEKDGVFLDAEDEKFIAADKRITKKVPPIQLLERWEGAHLTVIADGSVIIREEEDPFKIGRHPLLVSMNYVIAGRPYAYGEIDAIYKPVRAQDTIVNQNIQLINRSLRDSILVDPDAQIDLDALMLVLENGGVTFGKPGAVGPVPVNFPPQSAFLTIDTLQQAIERAARFSPYATGIPSQETDKTMGTMGGIQSLQRAAEPNFQIKLDTIEDSFMRPLARIYLKMIANLMGEDEVRYALLRGKKPQWVAATKGILTGKATLKDMLISGMLTPEQFQEAAFALQQQGKDPNKHIIFDVDWFVDVRLDNQSEIDKFQKTQSKMTWIDWAKNQLGIQFSPERTATEIGRGFGIEDPESLYLTEEEKQKKIQEIQMIQDKEQADLEAKAKMKLMENMHKMDLESLRQRGAMLREKLKKGIPTQIPPEVLA
jgi:hypothetical protein